jgi:hypothetical protein
MLVGGVAATELTFELAQRERMCFYEEIEGGVQATLEYQVGGNCRPFPFLLLALCSGGVVSHEAVM